MAKQYTLKLFLDKSNMKSVICLTQLQTGSYVKQKGKTMEQTGKRNSWMRGNKQETKRDKEFSFTQKHKQVDKQVQY